MEAMRFFAGRCWPFRQSYLSLCGLTLLLLPAGGAGNPAAAYAAEGTGQRVYQVQHSVFGDIGTYTNQIETTGPTMTVKTTAHFKVSALGVSMHNEDAQRTEKWQGDRLVSFEGVTKKNGDVTEVKGQATGNNFVISSPAGTVNAPATIHPANPVSLKSLQSATMMRVDTGKVEQVKLSGGGETTVSVNGNSVKAREYEITGSTHYKIWINNEDVPVKFVVDDDSGEVTFTLKK
jgi:Family of unknown function (DUF6134)